MLLHRRALLIGLVCSAAPQVHAAAIAPGTLRAVRIDTGGLAAKGLSNYARRVAAVATAQVPRVFGGQIVPGARGAPSLVVQINTVLMASSLSAGGGMFDDEPGPFGRRRMMATRDRPYDQIEGVGVLIDGAGRVIRSHPVYTTNDATRYGPEVLPDNEVRRLAGLTEVLLYWIKREMSL